MPVGVKRGARRIEQRSGHPWTIVDVSVDHYENFPVASILCPPRIRPAVVAIYWYARTADDLADEGDVAPAQRLADLAAFRADLDAVCAGAPPSPRWPQVFGALAAAMRSHALPRAPLADLLSAFAQDVVVTRYADRPMLLDYCARSANPVGRLLLHLNGITDEDALRQSDAICTALQLTNFWQDLGVDTRRGRLYLPASDCAAAGLPADAVLAGHDSPALRSVVAQLVRWTRNLMREGAPLVHRMPGRAGWELRLVVQGGLRILDKIDADGHATLLRRPKLGVGDAPAMLWRALRMRSMPPLALGTPA